MDLQSVYIQWQASCIYSCINSAHRFNSGCVAVQETCYHHALTLFSRHFSLDPESVYFSLYHLPFIILPVYLALLQKSQSSPFQSSPLNIHSSPPDPLFPCEGLVYETINHIKCPSKTLLNYELNQYLCPKIS